MGRQVGLWVGGWVGVCGRVEIGAVWEVGGQATSFLSLISRDPKVSKALRVQFCMFKSSEFFGSFISGDA